MGKRSIGNINVTGKLTASEEELRKEGVTAVGFYLAKTKYSHKNRSRKIIYLKGKTVLSKCMHTTFI